MKAVAAAAVKGLSMMAISGEALAATSLGTVFIDSNGHLWKVDTSNYKQGMENKPVFDPSQSPGWSDVGLVQGTVQDYVVIAQDGTDANVVKDYSLYKKSDVTDGKPNDGATPVGTWRDTDKDTHATVEVAKTAGTKPGVSNEYQVKVDGTGVTEKIVDTNDTLKPNKDDYKALFITDNGDLTVTVKDTAGNIVTETVNVSSATKSTSKMEVTDNKITFKQQQGAKDPSGYGDIKAGNNIQIKKTGDTEATISLKDDIKVKSVKIGSGPKSVVFQQGNVNMGGNRVQGVAAGTADTDAVNFAQLKATEAQFNQRMNSMDRHIDRVEDNAYAGVAMALATAGLPQSWQPGKSMIAMAAGTYMGEQGYAIGVSHNTENGKWSFKATASGNSQGHWGGSVGAGYMW